MRVLRILWINMWINIVGFELLDNSVSIQEYGVYNPLNLYFKFGND